MFGGLIERGTPTPNPSPRAEGSRKDRRDLRPPHYQIP